MEKQKKTFKLSCIILFSIVVILLVLAFALPKFLTTEQITRLANTQIPGKMEAQSIHLNWFDKQTVQGLKLYDPQGNLVLELNEATVNSLASLLFQKWSSNINIKVKGLHGHIVRNSTGNSNLHQALGIETSKEILPPIEVTLTDVNASIDPFNVNLTGQFESKGKQGSIELKAEMEKGVFPENLKVLTARTKGFPVDILEQLVSLQNPRLGKILLVALGETLDLKLDHNNENNSPIVQLQAKSPLFLATLSGNLSSEGFTLAEPGKVAIQLTPELLQLFPEIQRSEITLTKPMTIEALFDHLKIPFPFNLAQTEMHARLNVENALLTTMPKGESVTIHDVNANFDKSVGNPLFNITFKGYVSQQSSTSKIDLELAFDDKFKHLDAKGSLDPFILKHLPGNQEIVLQNIKFNIESTSLKDSLFHLTANLAPEDNKQLADLLGSPAALEIEGSINSKSKEVAIDNIRASLKSTNAQLEFNGNLNSGKIFVDHLHIGDASLVQMTIPWEMNAAQNILHLSFQGKTALRGAPQKGNITGQAEIKNWQKQEEMAYSIQLQALQLPMALLENHLKQEYLRSLFGSSFDLKLQASNHGITLNVDGDQFDGIAHLKIGDFITLQSEERPAVFHYALTPARFEALRKTFKQTHAISLQSTSEMTVSISKLKLPWKAANATGELQADFKINQLKAWEKTTEQLLSFEDLTGNVLSNDIAKQINFSLRAFQADRNELIMNGELDNAMTENNQLNTASMSVKLQAQAKKLPASLFCEIACLEKTTRIKMEALLGPVLDAEIAVQLQKMNGPVQIQLEGSNGKVQMDAQINKGFLTLNKPFVAEVTASPQLGESVLQEIIPILGGMISAENRLQIIIDPNGFSCPIDLHDLTQIQVGMMTVDLGKVQFSNQGQLGKILSVFKAKPQNVISVWFTPIYVEMQAGRINLQRFDMLAMDAFPLATWGSIDLPGNYIDMVVGLSGKSLQNAIGLPTLDKNYIMQFPYRGPIGKANVDKRKAAAKIAALTASLTGTPQGLAIGAVIGLASGSLTEEKAPAPTTTPFPWTSQEENTADEQEKKSSKNPLKSLKKGASNLINNIFR
jgi:hypothetical protein